MTSQSDTLTAYFTRAAQRLGDARQAFGYARLTVNDAAGFAALYERARACRLVLLVTGGDGAYPKTVCILMTPSEALGSMFPAALDGTISVDDFLTEVNSAVAEMPDETFFPLAVDSPSGAAAEHFAAAGRAAYGDRFMTSRLPGKAAERPVNWFFAIAGPAVYSRAAKETTPRALRPT